MQNAKLGSIWGKVRTQATAAGAQASTMLKDGSVMASQGGSSLMQGFALPGEAQKAAKILQSFLADPSHPQSALNAIPKAVLLRAKGSFALILYLINKLSLTRQAGLAVFTILKAGFVFSGKAGSGLVIAKLPDGSWSAPSCIATAGVGWGLQIGMDVTEVVIVLNSEEAVKAFSRGGNVTVGGGISAAAGPIGTGGNVSASLANPAPMFSYSRSRGLFAGITLDGTILVERKDANRDFYGSTISATDILGGRVPVPEIASPMYDIIEAAEGLDESDLPQEGYVPTATGEHGPIPAQGYPGTGQAVGGQTVFDARE